MSIQNPQPGPHPCDCNQRQPQWDYETHAHYDDCPTLAPPPPPPPPPPAAAPAPAAPAAPPQAAPAASGAPSGGWKPLPKPPAGEGDFPPNLRFALNMPQNTVQANEWGADGVVTGWQATDIECRLDNYRQVDTKNGSRWVLSLTEVAGIPEGKAELWANTCLAWYCTQQMLRVGHRYRIVLARVGSNRYQDFDLYELG